MRSTNKTVINSLLRTAFLLPMLLCASLGNAQKLKIEGRMKIEEGDLRDAKMVVYKNGKKVKTINSGLSRFELELDLQSEYLVSFEKEGYVSKKLSFNTKAPAEAVENGFAPFNFVVSLFEQYDDMNTVVFNQPVGKIRYEPDVDDFDYDTDYTKSIQSQLEDAMKEVEKRKEQKKKLAKQQEKQAAAATKAKEKAETQAAKQAEKEAQQKAERERALAEQQRKEQERKKKEEAERLERDRKLAEQRAREEEQRKEAEKKVAEKKEESPPPPPLPISEKKTELPPPPLPRKVVSSGISASSVEGEDTRRTIVGMEGSEEDPTTRVAPATIDYPIEEPIVEVPEVVRNEELLVEGNKLVKLITLTEGEEVTEFKKITHKWGGVFYFKNGESCSQYIYQAEALED